MIGTLVVICILNVSPPPTAATINLEMDLKKQKLKHFRSDERFADLDCSSLKVVVGGGDGGLLTSALLSVRPSFPYFLPWWDDCGHGS